MAMTRAFVLAYSIAVASADGFLTARAQVAREDVKQLLLSELSGQTNNDRLRSIEHSLRPMFAALPKSDAGRLDPPVVRYALHRHFVRRHGWYVKGLDSADPGGDLSTRASVLKARAPAYI